MNQLDHLPHRDASGFLVTRRRAVPVVETPSWWRELLMTALYLAACGLAAYVVFSA
jgi:hypothetical protein